MGVIFLYSPASECESWVNSLDDDAFRFFHQHPDTTLGIVPEEMRQRLIAELEARYVLALTLIRRWRADLCQRQTDDMPQARWCWPKLYPQKSLVSPSSVFFEAESATFNRDRLNTGWDLRSRLGDHPEWKQSTRITGTGKVSVAFAISHLPSSTSKSKNRGSPYEDDATTGMTTVGRISLKNFRNKSISYPLSHGPPQRSS
jgi:hypothetical protein